MLALNPFIGFDMQAVARWQYGPLATLWPTPAHAYGWAAKLPGDNRRLPLDLAGYLRAKHGADWLLLLRGMGGGDWAGFQPDNWDWTVIPVVLVASDCTGDVAGVAKGVANFAHNVSAVQDWYGQQLGRTFRVLQPQVFHSSKTREQWYGIYRDQVNRWDLFDVCRDELQRVYGGKTNDRVIYVVTQFCGLDSDMDYDAAGGQMWRVDGRLSVVSSFACSHRYALNSPGDRDDTLFYALAHEIGHNFDLDHPADTPANNDDIMMRGRPPRAFIGQAVRPALLRNPYFCEVYR